MYHQHILEVTLVTSTCQIRQSRRSGRRSHCVLLEGAKRIETTDRTFTGSGKIGMWTKADSVIYFDDFHVVAK